MQMQPVQSMTDKREFIGLVDGISLQATCHPTDEAWAKELLMTLHRADRARSWTLEIQCDSIAFWCDLHPTYGYRMTASEVTKGYFNLIRRGQELVERIKAGCA